MKRFANQGWAELQATATPYIKGWHLDGRGDSLSPLQTPKKWWVASQRLATAPIRKYPVMLFQVAAEFNRALARLRSRGASFR